MTYWLKMLGSGGAPMSEEIVPVVLGELRFPRRPSLRVGDKLALYALGHDKVFAIVEAFTRVSAGEGPNPWDKWRCEVRPILWTDYASAPSLDELSDLSRRDLRSSIRQQSHLTLSEDEYQRAVFALRRVGANADSLYRP